MFRSLSWPCQLFCILLAFVSPVTVASTDQGFEQWKRQFRKEALSQGITPEVFDRAFAGVNTPDQWVLDKANYQPEFKAPVWQYFDNRVQQRAIQQGRQKREELKPWLDRIERRFGVDRDILLAIWSIESSYGAILGNQEVVRNLVRSLATLAYADPKRSKFGRQQLIAALKILQSGDIDEGHLVGSWAGAMGHTQFIPTSYLAYAVDIDGDGRRDIWNSVPDALATAASLLAKNGWRTGETWGYEVVIPNRKLPAGRRTLAEWQKLGVRRANGKPFPRPADKAELKLPAGPDGPAFLMLKNFRVIKRYNNSDRYATAVGLLGDQIGGGSGLVHDWPRPFTPIDSTEVEELQKLLREKGFYDGEIDGKAGPATRKAIRVFEQSLGAEVQGYPSREILERLRGGR
ncbi:lytic murein transglycosylase [Microbulbifer sp. TYP-18]|uniref:lytic murein transglycosylase n=1 Tax=Microbulbifer sp. TYP-18 TaxID=3230024 RepID=UPI0034C62825